MKLFPCNQDISYRKVAEALLEEGIIMIRLLSRREGVVLPGFLNTPIVNLNFSYRFGIPDFEVDDRGIRASLSFHGEPMFCDIPWTAVCAIISEKTDQAFVWISAFDKEELRSFLPPQMRAMLDEEEEEFSVLEEFPELKRYAVSSEEEKAEEDADEEDDDDDDDIPPGGYTPLRFV